LEKIILKASTFWPIVAVLGPRQAGKSTLLREQLSLGQFVTLDDEDTLDDVKHSAKVFLQKMPTPLIVDEAQKAPKLFDALKLLVDRKRLPGKYFLTGSSQFSAKIGIRESLTGRIGVYFLYPLTLAEAFNQHLDIKRATPWHHNKARFKIESMLLRFQSGALPVPLFTRDKELIDAYHRSWFDTTILRDAPRAYGRGYNPDMAISLIQQLTAALKLGDYATLKHFKQPARTVRRYMECFTDIFLVRAFTPHLEAIGGDLWTLFDTGVFAHLAGGVVGTGVQMSLIRICVLNEILANSEYSGQRLKLSYYKTARGAPIDLIWNDVLIKISHAQPSQVDYDLRPLRAAMKKLNFKKGVLLWGRDKIESEKFGDSHIMMCPWTHFS
jgi:predicted AAA+ superfamily ATPase